MATNTISGSVGYGVTLGSAYASPLTITATGTINNAGAGDALHANYSATAANAGTIVATGDYSGINFAGGYISNSSSGLIQAEATGVSIGVLSTIVNSGTISQSSSTASATYAGVYLAGADTLTNNALALIEGHIGINAANGVLITIANKGTISGDSSGGTGIVLAGGTITNYRHSSISGGVGIAAVGSTVIRNIGTITGSSGTAVVLSGGGYISNSALGVIKGAIAMSGSAGTLSNLGRITASNYTVIGLAAGGTVTNSAVIASDGYHWGVSLTGAGKVTNNGNGYIYGGVHSDSGLATIVNTGTISNYDTAIDLRGGGTVTNTGTITSYGTTYRGIGVYLAAGSTLVNNASTAAIVGYYGVYAGDRATVTNDGYIIGTGALSVFLKNGGVLANNNGAAIFGGNIGVYAYGGTTTLTNSGTITGGVAAGVYLLGGGSTVVNSGTISGSYAVRFLGTGNNRLVLYSGSTLTGIVKGSSAGGATNTLELGSATNAGTLSGLGGQFLNFGTVTVDASAVWQLSGSNTLTGTLTDFGTLTNSGALTINGNLIVEPVTFVNSGSVSGAVTLSAGSYLGNNSGGTIQSSGNIALSVASGTATIANSGSIQGSPLGIDLNTGGTVVNNAGGVIRGAAAAIEALNGAGTVTNSGSIIGSAFFGVHLDAGGAVTNNGTGLIEGTTGLAINGAGTATVMNSGTILGDGGGPGVSIYNSAVITNNSAGLLKGSIGVLGHVAATTIVNTGTIIGTSGAGVYLGSGGTVVNAGTINGHYTAINFVNNGRLVLESGYSLGGTVNISGSGNILELRGATGDVDVDFNSHGLNTFDTAQFGALGGYNETLTISSTLGLPGTIASFVTYGDIVDITQLNPVGLQAPMLQGGNQLVVTNGSQTVTLNLDSEDYSHVLWQAAPDGNGGTDVSVACYCRGTMILTADGEVPVEELRIGDRLLTLSGEARTIRWIGRRGYDGRFVAGNQSVLPICVTAGAVADGMPARNLWVSPEHSLYIDEVLVQAKHLVNGCTVVQPDSIDRVEYFHIELEDHQVIYADGMSAETFVDCDNRLMFANGCEYGALYPDDSRPRWQFCAPRLEWGMPELAAIREALIGRARELGYPAGGDCGAYLTGDRTGTGD